MASMHKSREEHARSAAQKAADELVAASRRDDDQISPRSGGGGGILSGVQESARSVMGAVRGTFSGGASAADKTAASAVMESAKDYAAEKKEGARLALAGDAVGRKGETDEGRSATENIYGKARGAMGAFGEKMVMPTDVVEHKRAEVAGAGREAAAPAAGDGGDEAEEDVMLRVKAADQMTGQAFNDVGPMGGEGTGMPRRR
ncbi:hypothetical protein HU200_021250 [Digitaria exilis]|uniref:Uncharacterized protein n=1 Tax=Digitaria exilis TaxID=1010633 RepID=A0A835F030_9POAL|nr:hypothetical protein HU200_021250 [Digitaria exilis]